MRRCLLFIAFVLLTFTFGCKKNVPDQNNKTVKYNKITDAAGRTIEIPYPVTRAAVSNAYNVELINAIGAIDKIVGVDYYIYQDKESWQNIFTEDMIIGKSQSDINYEKLVKLNPEILILTGNGSYAEAERRLAPFSIKVIVIDAYYTEQFAKNCILLGEIFGKQDKAIELAEYFTDKLSYINKQLQNTKKKRVYFEYRRAGYTTVPGNYFFNMVEFSHADNIFKNAPTKDVNPEAVITENPDYIIKVSAPDVYSSYYPPTIDEHKAIYTELKNRPGWDYISAIKNGNVLLLSHYVHGGASKLVGTMYIAKFLYPQELPDLDPDEIFKDWLVKFQHLDYIGGHTYTP